MAKGKKLTNREKKIRAETKKRLQKKGIIPSNKQRLNFCESSCIFDISSASGNLKLFMNVLDKLGVRMESDVFYKEY